MWETIRSFRINFVLAAVVYLLLGLALIIWPDTSLVVLCYATGAMLTAFGLFHLIGYFRQRYTTLRLELAIGILSTAFGLYTLVQPRRVSEILFVVLGLVIVIDGALSIRRALRLHTYYFPYWWVPLVISLVMCALGVGVMFRPFASAALLLRITGVVLVFQGIHDLWCVRQLAVLTRHVEELSQQAHPEDEPPF